MEEAPRISEEYQTYIASYNHVKGLITIDFSPEAIQFSIKNGTLEEDLDRIRMMVGECFRKSVIHLNSHQSISEPLKLGG